MKYKIDITTKREMFTENDCLTNMNHILYEIFKTVVDMTANTDSGYRYLIQLINSGKSIHVDKSTWSRLSSEVKHNIISFRKMIDKMDLKTANKLFNAALQSVVAQMEQESNEKRSSSDERTAADIQKVNNETAKLKKEVLRNAMKIVKSFGGIIDKTKLADELFSNTVDYMSKLNKGYWDMVANEAEIRQLVNRTIHELSRTTCLEWHNLVMSCAGYKRIVRIMTQIQSVVHAAQMGVDLDIGMNRLPNQWHLGE